TAEQVGARYVATGHTADDQVETVLHHILRGTGIDGLAGIRRTRAISPSVALVRPLLWARRSDVLSYLQALGQEFRIDRSNEDVRFTRNRIRNELLPELRQNFNQNVDDALLRLASQAAEAQQVISEAAGALMERCVELDDDSVRIRCVIMGESAAII